MYNISDIIRLGVVRVKRAKEDADGDERDKAIKNLQRQGVLADFFRKNRAEVLTVGIFEYDEEKVRAMLREETIEDGMEQGIAKGIEKGFEF